MKKKTPRCIICFILTILLTVTLTPVFSYAENETSTSADTATEATVGTVEETTAETPTEAVQPTTETAEPTTKAAETEPVTEAPESTAPKATSGTITGFEPLETDSYYYEGNPEEEDITVKLPKTLEVYLDGSNAKSAIPVTWEAVEDFDKTDFYFYSMKPVWGDSFSLSPELNDLTDVPWVTVYKQEPLCDEVEPMATEDELDPIYVNEGEALKEAGEGTPETTEETKATEPSTETQPTEVNSEAQPSGVDSETQPTQPTDPTDNIALKIMEFFADESYAANTSNTDIIYQYLTKNMGLNRAAACGVMTNINAESAMSPINLENSYNTRYGLSDAEYTKRVDAGKGAYKTKSGSSRNFKTDYCGYGICQWTSLNRRKNLLNKALNKKTSVGDIRMQLEFLSEELNGNYSSVMNTLRSVPDNPQGAYMAAFVFCMNFEVPANTLGTAASRGKTCLSSSGYWKKYSGSAASVSGASFLSLTGYTYPITMKPGKGLTVKGYAISNYKITSISAVITDANGVKKYSASASPDKTVYSLYKFDDEMKFGKLAVGDYTYTITAKDKSGKTIKAVRHFKISSYTENKSGVGFCMKNESTPAPKPATTTTTTKKTTTSTSATKPTVKATTAASTMDIYSFNYPKKLKRKKSFNIKGKILSNYPLRKVTVQVVDTKGKVKISASKKLTGNSKKYKLKKLNKKVKFKKIKKKGTYYYQVIATDTKATKRLINKKFTVK